VIHVGTDDWAFPIPLVKVAERWRFDPRQGREEIVARRIGRNELYNDADVPGLRGRQREYYAEDRDGERFSSSTPSISAARPASATGSTGPPSPLSRPARWATWSSAPGPRGNRREKSGPTPFYGYFYRILTAQGPDAPGGEYDYVARGKMIAGFALVAFPAQYGVSGVMTFIVNHDGVVYQKDLGPGTRATALAMRKFNPDGTWAKTEVPEVGR